MRFFNSTLAICLLWLFNSLPIHASEGLFDAVLQEHVSPQGEVNYPVIGADPRFAEYLDYLEKADPAAFATKEEQLAFWINAYNALAIKGILDGLSPNGFFSRISYFKTTTYPLAGKDITLYDLEHDIIIPFGEPRIHFAIVCASASCPKLIAEAYTAEKLDQQLEANSTAFINNEFKNQFDLANKTASISKIFDWFAEDFIKADGSVQRFLAKYVAGKETANALAEDGFDIDYLEYDWSLNGKPAE